jgi:putative DNA primase/helicase
MPLRAPTFSEDSLALRFADRHAGTLRYVAAWSKWMNWNGGYWDQDATKYASDEARKVCREASAECNDHKIATAVASAKTVAAIERLATVDRRLAATVDQWDADPWLLNTPSGTINLQTGDMRIHRPGDYITRSTAVGPGPNCPIWHQFLARVTNCDLSLQQFLQRMAGYALTGSTREHALFFLYGTGANGKSVFLSAISGILDGYHRTAPIETFTAANTERHPTDLAGLRGARLVTAIETEEGRRWAESRIKTLTGGDKVSARFMRQNFFEYAPQFKLMIAGNHKPGLRSVDEAIRRRFNLVPFTVTIPPEERDKDLSERLRDEWPGILEWMIEGCIGWQERGLAPPSIVTESTAAYLEAEDAISAWIDDCAMRDPNAFTRSSELFGSWTEWATKSGEFVGSQKRFSQTLETRGFLYERGKDKRGFRGLRLLSAY